MGRNTLLAGAVAESGPKEQTAAEAAPAPELSVCPGCHHSYVPAEHGISCPNCGVAQT